MVTVVVFEFSVMRCQPLRRALCNSGKFRAQSFGISPAIRFVLSANEHFYLQIHGELKP